MQGEDIGGETQGVGGLDVSDRHVHRQLWTPLMHGCCLELSQRAHSTPARKRTDWSSVVNNNPKRVDEVVPYKKTSDDENCIVLTVEAQNSRFFVVVLRATGSP